MAGLGLASSHYGDLTFHVGLPAPPPPNSLAPYRPETGRLLDPLIQRSAKIALLFSWTTKGGL